jgi:protein-tyrosine phosphatase
MASDEAPRAALRVDWVELPKGGRIGMTHCPGRRGRDGSGHVWQRDLESDLQDLLNEQVPLLVSLVEEREFETLGVPGLPMAAASRLAWHHLPIADMTIPGVPFFQRWDRSCSAVLQVLEAGGRVVLHCAAGLGRTGTIAAKLLTDCVGLSADEAIERIRQARPGTIETSAQEAFVRGPARLSPPRVPSSPPQRT